MHAFLSFFILLQKKYWIMQDIRSNSFISLNVRHFSRWNAQVNFKSHHIIIGLCEMIFGSHVFSANKLTISSLLNLITTHQNIRSVTFIHYIIQCLLEETLLRRLSLLAHYNYKNCLEKWSSLCLVFIRFGATGL